MKKSMTAILTLALALSTAAPAQNNDAAEVQFKAALHQETVDGDLKGAIERYKRILSRAGSNRDLAARALLQAGSCYEKLGDTDARQAYERVVREFGDRAEVAGRARARLSALGRTPAAEGGVTVRKVWSAADTDGTGTPSPDGRSLSYVHWDTGDLAIRDLTTGQNRLLTNKGPWSKSPQYADMNVMSPDGKQIAYGWDLDQDGYELRVIRTDGTGMRTIASSKVREWIKPYDWSRDGKFIAAAIEREWLDNTTKLVTVDVASGATRVLKTLDSGRHRYDRLAIHPSGRYVAYSAPAEKGRSEHDVASDRSERWARLAAGSRSSRRQGDGLVAGRNAHVVLQQSFRQRRRMADPGERGEGPRSLPACQERYRSCLADGLDPKWKLLLLDQHCRTV